MVRYVKNSSGYVWKEFLSEAINKCGGCGESTVDMER